MRTILVDAWNTFVTEKGINDHIKKILDTFPNRKIIVTNANADECIKFGIVNMPYEVFSLEHQPNKTDTNYFIKLFEDYNLTSQDVIYFEHNEEAYKAAKSLGINSFHYKSAEELDDLEQFLKTNL